jgi:hypothetical protein
LLEQNNAESHLRRKNCSRNNVRQKAARCDKAGILRLLISRFSDGVNYEKHRNDAPLQVLIIWGEG